MEESPIVRLRPSRRYFYANAAFFGSLSLGSLALAPVTDRFAQPQHREERMGLKVGIGCAVSLALFTGGYVLAADPSRYYLELTPDGLTERQLVFKRSRRLSDIERFWAGYDDGPHVAVRYSERYRLDLPPWRARLGLTASGRLFGTYGKTAEQLADLLNEWRGRYAEGGGGLSAEDDRRFLRRPV